jgi:hypothetical protein
MPQHFVQCFKMETRKICLTLGFTPRNQTIASQGAVLNPKTAADLAR